MQRMTWQLTSQECLFIAIVAFGVIGFQRGWRREVISLAFTLTCILFLIFGNVGLAQFVYVNLPRAITTLTTGHQNPQPAPTITANDPKVAISTSVAFLVFIALGYLVSTRVMPKAATTPDRLWGIIPGIIAGYAILTFFTNALNKSSLFQLSVNPPNQNLIGSYLLVVFIIIVVVVILALISASAKKSGGGVAKKP
jgi:uncharacterized membrane protein required for colicin V production